METINMLSYVNLKYIPQEVKFEGYSKEQLESLYRALDAFKYIEYPLDLLKEDLRATKSCNCSMEILMKTGCQCGGT